MNQDEQNEPHNCIAFDINIEDIRPKSGRPPPRFREYQQRSQVNKMKSSEEICQKQKQADERRKVCMLVKFSCFDRVTWHVSYKKQAELLTIQEFFNFYLWVMVFNATFNTISVILWQSVLLVEET